jgi:hypothetical protein
LAISFVTSSVSNLQASKSCVHPFRVSRLCSALADAWVYRYTDFGESHESLGRPVLRASFPVGVPGGLVSFSALVDTGGPITLVAHDVVEAVGGDAVDTGETFLGQIGFLENFTVTFGPEGSAVEAAASFEEGFGPPA